MICRLYLLVHTSQAILGQQLDVHFFLASLPAVRPAPALNLKRMISPSSTT